MLNIFYQNSSLNDTLIINFSFEMHSFIKVYNSVSIGYDSNNKPLFINYSNFSKILKLNNGLIFPTKSLCKLILEKTNIDIMSFFDNGFKIGKIINIEKIPNSHLHYCKVLIDNEKCLSIVCGANNIELNSFVVVATNNTMLPNGKIITNGKVLNYYSEGMLCSSKELNLEKESSGIIILKETDDIYFKKVYSNL